MSRPELMNDKQYIAFLEAQLESKEVETKVEAPVKATKKKANRTWK